MGKTLRVKDVSKSLKKLKNLGHLEDTFEILGVSLRLKTIQKNELTQAHLKCKPSWVIAQAEEDSLSLQAWIREFQIEVLSYSIVAMDDMDFDDVKFIETEEVVSTSNGDEKPVLIQKHVFVRGILSDWEDSTLSTVYKKFQELGENAEKKALEGVVFKNDEINSKMRIDELEAELESLKVKVSQNTETQSPVITTDALKQAVYSPDSEYIYEDKPQQGSVPSGHQTPSETYLEPEKVVYVDDAGRELSEEELLVAKEQDRLYQQRLDEQAASRPSRRPLNQVNADVREASSPLQNPNDVRTVNAAKARQEFSREDIPIAGGFTVYDDAPLTKEDTADFDRVVVDEKPLTNINHNFLPTKNF